MDGVRLLFLHPKIANLSCEDCATWMYDENKDQVYRNDGKGGKIPQKRIHPPPCHDCPKTEGQKQRIRANACQGLSEKNQQALQHYLECKATGNFPDDPIVRRNAAIIGPYYEMVTQQGMQSILTTMLLMSTTKK
jgi:hypothetical protein